MLIQELVKKLVQEFYGMLNTNSQVCIVLEKSKETVLEFYKGTVSVVRTYKWLNTTQ